MKYNVYIGKQGKYSGFYHSIDYVSKNGSVIGILTGILKRACFYCDSNNLNLGFIYINLSAIKKILRSV